MLISKKLEIYTISQKKSLFKWYALNPILNPFNPAIYNCFYRINSNTAGNNM